jgi:hypothetical protein
MRDPERIGVPFGGFVDTCITHAALPILFRDLDRATFDDATQTSGSAHHRVNGLRHALSVLAGSLGFIGPDAIGDLRAWTEAMNDDGGNEYPDDTARRNGPIVIGQPCPWCGAMVTDADHVRSHD